MFPKASRSVLTAEVVTCNYRTKFAVSSSVDKRTFKEIK